MAPRRVPRAPRTPAAATASYLCKVSHAERPADPLPPDRATRTQTCPRAPLPSRSTAPPTRPTSSRSPSTSSAHPGDDRNRLPEILRGWFGPDAGLPGTRHEVALEQGSDGWQLRPSAKPTAASSSGAATPANRSRPLRPPLLHRHLERRLRRPPRPRLPARHPRQERQELRLPVPRPLPLPHPLPVGKPEPHPPRRRPRPPDQRPQGPRHPDPPVRPQDQQDRRRRLGPVRSTAATSSSSSGKARSRSPSGGGFLSRSGEALA